MSAILPKKRRRRGLGRIERDVLEELSGSDLLYGMLLSAHSTRRMLSLARARAIYRYRRRRAIERLIKLDHIQKRVRRLSITEKGRDALGETVGNTRKLLEAKKWDHKWRIATFDIPEKYAMLRDKVRAILKRAGFVRLQHSVWVFPHECGELVQLIKRESKLSDHILYGVLERIENEDRLKKLFRLR